MRSSTITGIAFLLLASCTQAPDRQPSTKPALELSEFAQTIDSLRIAAQIPGLSVAVVRDGEVIFARGFGYADLERRIPATPETPYDIASVTKPISAVVAFRLVEEGRLDLDRPIADYSEWAAFCSEFREQPTLFAKGLTCDPPVHTLRHLLTHTATGQPGARFTYNPVLFSWASRPIMQATGSSFSDLVAHYVFRAAGMTHSARRHRDLPLRTDLAETIALPYHVDSTGAVVRSPRPSPQGDGAAGGIVSTVLDLARFDAALERGTLLSPPSYDAMMRPMRSPAGESLAYSVGWFAQQYEGHEIRWHSGWWDDAYSALYLKVPDEDLTFIVLANSEGIWWDNPLDSAQVQQSAFAQAFFRAFL
ncbi:MAG TPA: serine hydrolase domain-containing protein [Thermoanaerobaculia bacterium]|nr:serine hydrolase domain-containing protein [Thermoanaerobaculia bacterium]